MEKKNNKIKYPRGSEWRKWDLHIHTPFSYLNNQFGNDFDYYIQQLFKKAIDKDITAIGITDYFTIEGYKKLKEEYLNNEEKLKSLFTDEEIEKIKKILILPNIEVRLNKLVGTQRINFHIVFSNEISIRDIEENFLRELKFVYEGGPQTEDEKRQLTTHNLIELGKRLKNEHEGFKNKSNIEIGMMNAVVNNEDICKILSNKKSIFEGKYLLFVPADEDLSEISWDSQDHNVRKVIIQESDGIFSSNGGTIKFGLGKRHLSQKAFIKEFKSLKPCIWSSDAKNYDKLFEPDEKRYTWIKAGPTFEGLKQIIYEPELRVKIQADNPTETETYARIVNCSINLPPNLEIKDSESEEKTRFCLQGEYTFCLSNNLTSIIGGRGSGKSTLIHLLYNKQINKELDRLDNVNSPLLNLDLGRDPLKKVADLTETDAPATTEFFLQNEIEKFARDIGSMSELVRHRLNRLSSLDEAKESLKELQGRWESEEREMDAFIQAYDQISNSSKENANLRKDIDTLKKQTNVIKSKDYKTLKEKTEDVSNTISAFNRYQREYEELIESIDSLVEEIKQLDWDQFNGQKSLGTTTSKLSDSKKELESSFEQAKAKYDKENYPEQLKAKKLELKKYLKGKGLSPENIEELADAAEQINELTRRIRLLERKRQPYEQIYSKKEKTFENYKKAYNTYKERFFEATNTLENSLSGLPFSDKKKSMTEITFRPKLNEQSLKDTVTDFIKENVQSKGLSKDNIQNVLFSSDKLSDFVESKEAIKDAVDSSQIAEIHTKVLRECVSDDDFLEKLQLRIRRYYFDISNIQVQTKLGDKLLQNTSFGERCGIVIAIVLTAGTNPIVIDQPEDNLDGKFVSKILVHLLRKQKQNRQIILITRDANIVIGGDSELILILDTNNGKAELIPSTIEDRSTREKYIWILDGGKEAFQKRDQKYNFPK